MIQFDDEFSEFTMDGGYHPTLRDFIEWVAWEEFINSQAMHEAIGLHS